MSHQFPRGGLLGKAQNALSMLHEMNIPVQAAYAGYFIVLAVFPALLLILSALRYTGLEIDTLIGFLEQILPKALHPSMEELVFSTWQSATGTVVGISAIVALWSASRGIFGLLRGLNSVYGVTENRGYFYTRAISVLYALGMLIVLVFTLTLHVFGTKLMNLLHHIDHPLVIFLVDYLDLRFFLLLGLQTLTFTLMYTVLPNRRNHFLKSLPGGLFASLGWLIFSDLYSIYVDHFSTYANIYGSVYAIALCMLWLYFCLSIFLYGGALNRYLSAAGADN